MNNRQREQLPPRQGAWLASLKQTTTRSPKASGSFGTQQPAALSLKHRLYTIHVLSNEPNRSLGRGVALSSLQHGGGQRSRTLTSNTYIEQLHICAAWLSCQSYLAIVDLEYLLCGYVYTHTRIRNKFLKSGNVRKYFLCSSLSPSPCSRAGSSQTYILLDLYFSLKSFEIHFETICFNLECLRQSR
jgi:hypothetical protein